MHENSLYMHLSLTLVMMAHTFMMMESKFISPVDINEIFNNLQEAGMLVTQFGKRAIVSSCKRATAMMKEVYK